jgi:transcriptional regulator with XRE-family HTH domain
MPYEKKPDPEACRIIDEMGGTYDVAEKLDVTPQAVSQWRYGIPKPRLQTIKLMRPDLFEQAAA